MKTVNVLIANKGSKICTNAQQAIVFLQSKNIVVNDHSKNHLEAGFANINSGIVNTYGGVDYSFAAGNNSGNPTVWLKDVSGAKAQSDLGTIAKKVKEIIAEKYPNKDLRLTTLVTHDYILVEGGLNWYWSISAQRHFPMEELWFKSKNTSVEEIVTFIDKFISRSK